MRLSFDARLYSRGAVEAAAAAFGELAEFEIKESAGRIEVEARPKTDGLDGSFELEFANHVLLEMPA